MPNDVQTVLTSENLSSCHSSSKSLEHLHRIQGKVHNYSIVLSHWANLWVWWFFFYLEEKSSIRTSTNSVSLADSSNHVLRKRNKFCITSLWGCFWALSSGPSQCSSLHLQTVATCVQVLSWVMEQMNAQAMHSPVSPPGWVLLGFLLFFALFMRMQRIKLNIFIWSHASPCG